MRLLTLILLTLPNALPTPALATDELVEIDAIELMLVELPKILQLNGTLAPLRRTALAAEVGGNVTGRSCELGQRVEPGQVLVQLDSSSHALQVHWHRAQLDLARSQFTLADRTLERARALLQDSSLTREAFDQAQFDFERARSLARQARSSLDQARLDLSRTTIRAPFGGAVTSIEVEVGERVNPGQIAVHLAVTDTLKIRAEVDVEALAWLVPGLEVKIAPAAGFPPFGATLAHIVRVADPLSRRYAIEAIAAAFPPDLPLGSVAALTISTASTDTGVLVADAALRLFAGETYVYAIAAKQGETRVEQRRIRIARELPGGLFFVTEGLVPGERVAASGVALLADGARVRVTSVRRLDPPASGRP